MTKPAPMSVGGSRRAEIAVKGPQCEIQMEQALYDTSANIARDQSTNSPISTRLSHPSEAQFLSISSRIRVRRYQRLPPMEQTSWSAPGSTRQHEYLLSVCPNIQTMAVNGWTEELPSDADLDALGSSGPRPTRLRYEYAWSQRHDGSQGRDGSSNNIRGTQDPGASAVCSAERWPTTCQRRDPVGNSSHGGQN